jgi:hypothetical protein
MTGTRGQHHRQAMLARLARYAELRDGGALPAEAGRELGVSERTWGGYEREYRRRAGLPPREPGFPGRTGRAFEGDFR